MSCPAFLTRLNADEFLTRRKAGLATLEPGATTAAKNYRKNWTSGRGMQEEVLK
jgi:hypothetical protein